MSVISGKHAYIDNVPCVAQWQVGESGDLQSYAASCTAGGTGVSDGNIDWAGSASGIGHTPVLMPTGNDFTFKGVADNESGDAIVYDGTILVSQTTINIPIAAGGPITWASVFGCQGALTEGTSGAADATVAEAPSAKAATLKIEDTAAEIAGGTALSDIQSITLTFSRPASSYVSGGYVYRLPGNLAATIAFEILDRSLVNTKYAINAHKVASILVAAGATWELPIKWGSKTNFTVDTDTRAPVGYTVNGQWSSVVPTSIDDDAGGYIKNPADVYFFGAAPVLA